MLISLTQFNCLYAGLIGLAGRPGFRGISGPDGAKGDKGYSGLSGLPGRQGVKFVTLEVYSTFPFNYNKHYAYISPFLVIKDLQGLLVTLEKKDPRASAMTATQVWLIFKSNAKEQKGFDFWMRYGELSSSSRNLDPAGSSRQLWSW